MSFIISYKHLEKLCGDVLNDSRRISAYIDEMQSTPNGALYVPSWESDLKTLKHYRWIRNQIAHEPDCNEENMCTPADTLWLDDFYARILNQTDPLALYHKATTQPKLPTNTHKRRHTHPNRSKVTTLRCILLSAILLALLLAIAFFLFFR